MRIKQSNPQLPQVERGRSINLAIDGKTVQAFEGETISGVLSALGVRTLWHTIKHGSPRGMYCGIGVCYGCLVTVNGTQNIRACMTLVADGMVVETQYGGLS